MKVEVSFVDDDLRMSFSVCRILTLASNVASACCWLTAGMETRSIASEIRRFFMAEVLAGLSGFFKGVETCWWDHRSIASRSDVMSLAGAFKPRNGVRETSSTGPSMPALKGQPKVMLPLRGCRPLRGL